MRTPVLVALALLLPGTSLAVGGPSPLLDVLVGILAAPAAPSVGGLGEALHAFRAAADAYRGPADAPAVLRAALALGPLLSGGLQTSGVDVAGLVEIGTPGSDVFAADRALILDPGGDDTYANNAGGVGFSGPRVAIVIDAGGNDTYDARGTFTKVAQGAAVNAGFGLLLDLAGDDRYLKEKWDWNAQGSGLMQGVGVLADLAGNDVYVGGPVSQGVGSFDGHGLLYDGAGDDRYKAGTSPLFSRNGAQGFGGAGGVGALHDADGADAYRLEDADVGLPLTSIPGLENVKFWDRDVDDTADENEPRYRDDVDPAANRVDVGDWRVTAAGFPGTISYAAETFVGYASWGQGYGIGGGVGTLLDAGGADAYAAGPGSRGFGAAGDRLSCKGCVPAGLGVFLDLAGDDAYEAGPGADGASWGGGSAGMGADGG